MTGDRNSGSFSRRQMLRGVGATGILGVTGCLGALNRSGSETTTTEADTSTPVETTETLSYEIPAFDHVDTVEFFKEWMLLPPGEVFNAISYSPSNFEENYDTTFMYESNARDTMYDKFEFYDFNVPETFIEQHPGKGSPTVKIDQLPNNVSENDIVQQLLDQGYLSDQEIGDYTLYTHRADKCPHAVGNGRHIVGWAYSVPLERSKGVIVDVLEQETTDELTPGVETRDVFEVLDVHDSLTMAKDDTYMPIDQDYQPEIGASSVNFEEQSRYGAWAFEDEATADTAFSLLQNEDLWGNYDSIERTERFITAAEGNYELAEIDLMQLSAPYL